MGLHFLAYGDIGFTHALGDHRCIGGEPSGTGWLFSSLPHHHIPSNLIIRELHVKAIGLRERDLCPEHIGFIRYHALVIDLRHRSLRWAYEKDSHLISYA
jgi:hypothetical protein